MTMRGYTLDFREVFGEETGMQELKRLQAILSVCVVGVVISFGGAVYTAYKTSQEKKAQMVPEAALPVPATAQ
jgi:hypothetical protein